MIGGEIWVESELGRGSTFSFVVKVKPAQVDEDRPDSVPDMPQGHAPLKILLAEDNIVNSLFASHILQTLGHQVEVVENGKQVVEKLKQHTFDVVLMDAQMPVMDGEQATKLIRSGLAGDPGIPIVALTAYALSGDKERFLAAGMDDYISKPFDMNELDRVLKRVL
jgi:two-component system CheB/CheR fusion protein